MEANDMKAMRKTLEEMATELEENACDRMNKEAETHNGSGDCLKSVVDTKFELCNYPEQVLKIGRDFQNKDGFRGAHYDTVKLLCDTIEYQQEQLKTKTEVEGYSSVDVNDAIEWQRTNRRWLGEKKGGAK